MNLLSLLCRNRKRLQINHGLILNLFKLLKILLKKALFEQFKLEYQAGKGSKILVPILIPIDKVKPIMKLIEQRIEVEISDANPFLFANTGTSLDHAVGWQCIKAIIRMMGSE